MSKLNVDQKTIKDLFESKKTDFLIPDYQRPYAWQEKECQTLWDDIFSFAFPNNDYTQFDSDGDEYFLGPIVTFKNKTGKMEVIDGQQRLTTLMLLLRAFYAKFGNMQDDNSRETRKVIERCIWKTDEFGRPDKSKLKINSEVATDNEREEFLTILREGSVSKGQKSNYAVNYEFFQRKIDAFLNEYPSYFAYFPTRILQNCILLPIEAESQDTALRIFSTLNDRGKPLSDADIFKAQFYKFFSEIGKKDEFISNGKRWRNAARRFFIPVLVHRWTNCSLGICTLSGLRREISLLPQRPCGSSMSVTTIRFCVMRGPFKILSSWPTSGMTCPTRAWIVFPIRYYADCLY